MRPLTTKQHKLLNEICTNANDFQIFGHENQRDVGELRNWNRFDSDIIEKVEKNLLISPKLEKKSAASYVLLKM